MLHTQTVAPQTLGLLKQLEAEPRLSALESGLGFGLYITTSCECRSAICSLRSRSTTTLPFFLRSDTDSQTAFRRPDTLKGMIEAAIDCT